MIKPLTKVDVSRRSTLDPGVLWLIAAGFVLKFDGNRVFLVRDA